MTAWSIASLSPTSPPSSAPVFVIEDDFRSRCREILPRSVAVSTSATRGVPGTEVAR
jgi:hypothetical protein